MHYVYRKLKRWARSAFSSRFFRLLIGALISVCLFIMSFGVGAETPEGYRLVKQLGMDGSFATSNFLDTLTGVTEGEVPTANVVSYPYYVESSSTSLGLNYSFYELSSNKNVSTSLPYSTSLETSFNSNDAIITVSQGSYVEFGYAPRNSYNFFGFCYDFNYVDKDNSITVHGNSSLDSSGQFTRWLRKTSSSGYLLLSTGQKIQFGSFYSYSSGTVYDYYLFRAYLPAGSYRISEFHFDAWYQGTGSSSSLTFRISDLYIYEPSVDDSVPSYDQEKFDPPDGTELDKFHEDEQALLEDVEKQDEVIQEVLSPDISSSESGLDLTTSLSGIGGIFDELLGTNPWISTIVSISVSMGVIGFLLNLGSRRKG